MKSYSSVPALGAQIEQLFDSNRISAIICKDLSNGRLGIPNVVPRGKGATEVVYCCSDEDFVKNQRLYTVFCKTYFFVLKNRVHNDDAINAVLHALEEGGLINWIDRTAKYFDRFIYEGVIDESDPLCEGLLRLVLSTEYSDYTSVQVLSEVFRFGKRFCPFGTDELKAECVKSFLAIEAENRSHDRKESNRLIIDMVKLEAHAFFKNWDVIDQRVNRQTWEETKNKDKGNLHYLFFTSPNSIQAVCRARFCKQIALESHLGISNPYLSEVQQAEIALLTGVSNSKRFRKLYEEERHIPLTYDIPGDEIVNAIPVPKNYKSWRLVAPDSVKSYHNQMVEELKLRSSILDNKLAGEPAILHCPITDQSVQRIRAQEGSLTGDISTVDLSSASDYVRKSLIREVFPKKVADALLTVTPKGVILDGRARVLSCFALMGSPLTFRTMQILLYFICVAATKFVARFSGWSADQINQALRCIGVFGDDITIHTDVYETLLDFLTCLGLKVNSLKSCSSRTQLFREACGGDYFEGIDISVSYWPRHQIDIVPGKSEYWHEDGFTRELTDNVSTLVALSKNIRRFSPDAGAYLTRVCHRLQSKLTESKVGDSSPDLWSSFPRSKNLSPSPYGEFIWKFRGRPCNESNGYFSILRRFFTIHFEGKLPAELQGTDYTVLSTEMYDLLPDTFKTLYTRTLVRKLEERDPGLPLTSVPKQDANLKVPNPRGCVVEEYLLNHKLPITDMVRYELYLEFLRKGPSYRDRTHRILKVSDARKANTMFGSGSLTWNLTK